MVCPKCGREVVSNAQFCTECGFDLSSSLQEDYDQNDSKKTIVSKSGRNIKSNKADDFCSICSQNVATKKLADGQICSSCMGRTFDRSLRWRKTTVAMVQQSIQIQQCMDDRRAVFAATDGAPPFFEIDKTNQLIYANGRIYIPWEDVIDFTLLENGNEISRGGFGGALIGGVLFGGAGAIIGHSAGRTTVKTAEELAIKIVTRDEAFPQIRIDLIHGSVGTNTRAYKRAAESAQKILSLLTIVMDSVQNTSSADSKPEAESPLSVPEEIRQYKELMDEGILTQEEFEAKKKQLLGL